MCDEDGFVTFPELTRLDRCDKCGGHAVFAAVKNENLLLFCLTCYHIYSTALIEQGWEIDDQREKFLDMH